jgi:chemotaxis protein histidine kinase CheA
MNQAGDERAAAVKARMIELAEKFVARSAADLAVMRASLSRLSAGDVAALDEIRHLAHRMSGTGATLGFDPLSDCALRVEKLADENSAGRTIDEAGLESFEAALTDLGGQIARLQR